MNHIIKAAIILSYWIIGAYATTDITRLLKGATHSMMDPKCYCDICGHTLMLRDQIPVLSFVFYKGKCRYCSSVILWTELFFEALFLFVPSFVLIILDFSFTAYYVNVILYETTKVAMILIHGKRETHFLSNLVRSILMNCVIFFTQFILFFIFFISNNAS